LNSAEEPLAPILVTAIEAVSSLSLRAAARAPWTLPRSLCIPRSDPVSAPMIARSTDFAGMRTEENAGAVSDFPWTKEPAYSDESLPKDTMILSSIGRMSSATYCVLEQSRYGGDVGEHTTSFPSLSLQACIESWTSLSSTEH